MPTFKSPFPQRASDMVHHQCRLRKSACEIDYFVQLWMQGPGVKGQAQRCQQLVAPTKCSIPVQTLCCAHLRIDQPCVAVPGRGLSNPLESQRIGCKVLHQDFVGSLKPQICIADDTGTNLGLTTSFERPLCNRACKFRLSNRCEMERAILAIVGSALHIDGGDDAVAVPQIRLHVVEQIALSLVFPKMVMGIDDRQLGPEYGLIVKGKPIRAVAYTKEQWIRTLLHRKTVFSSIRG